MPRRRRIATVAVLLAGGAVAGWLASLAHVPLAWMIGPMVPVGIATIALKLPSLPDPLRCLGQMLMGASVGLYLTPAAVERILSFAPSILMGTVLMVLAACAISLVQLRLTRTDPATAIFANIPGGPVDMAVMAQSHGGDGARTAAYQTVRIASVVLLFPPALMLVSVELFPRPEIHGGLAASLVLAAIGAVGALAAVRLRLMNPYFIGPMLAAGLLTGSGMALEPFHPAVIPAAQVLIGVALGGMFQRSTFAGAGAFMASLVLTTVALLAASVLVALLQQALFGAGFATMALAQAPAAAAEMVITAQILHLDVPLVAAFQIARVLLGLMLGGLFFRLYTGRKPG